MTSHSKLAACTMLLAFRSLEEVYVRGKTVHFVGDGYRFYGNIECESASVVQVDEVLPREDSLLGAGREWGFWLTLTLDEEMAHTGQERIHFQFADQAQAVMVQKIFTEVATSIREGAA